MHSRYSALLIAALLAVPAGLPLAQGIQGLGLGAGIEEIRHVKPGLPTGSVILLTGGTNLLTGGTNLLKE